MRDNGFKQNENRFGLDIRKKFLTLRHWNKLLNHGKSLNQVGLGFELLM